MRKIEQEMLAAIRKNQNNIGMDRAAWCKDNTQVMPNGNEYTGFYSSVFLHGNHIADVRDSGMLDVNLETLRKWPSMTTRSRLRALGANLVSIKGTLHLDGKAI